MDLFDLIGCLEDELEELQEEASKCLVDDVLPRKRFLGECLDVAAYAFMLWERVDREERREIARVARDFRWKGGAR